MFKFVFKLNLVLTLWGKVKYPAHFSLSFASVAISLSGSIFTIKHGPLTVSVPIFVKLGENK